MRGPHLAFSRSIGATEALKPEKILTISTVSRYREPGGCWRWGCFVCSREARLARAGRALLFQGLDLYPEPRSGIFRKELIIGGVVDQDENTMRCISYCIGLLTISLCYSQLFAQGKGVGRFEDASYLSPVRPGEPGKIAFWNQYTRRFIFPPAFEFIDSADASAYRFTVTSVKDSQEYSFTAAHPWAPLTPVWKAVPSGEYTLRVEALPGGRTVGERRFMKSPHFPGVLRGSSVHVR